LKRAGYQTACVGKWGLGLEDTRATPDARGFDEFIGYLSQNHAHDYYPTSLWRSSRSAGEPLPPQGITRNQEGRPGTYSHYLFRMVASNYIRVSKYTPFFLYLPYPIPHACNELKPNGMVVPSNEPYARETWPLPEKNKAAMITRLDRDVGRLMAQIKTLGLES